MKRKVFVIATLLFSLSCRDGAHHDAQSRAGSSGSANSSTDSNMVRVGGGSYRLRPLHYRDDGVCTSALAGSASTPVITAWPDDTVVLPDFEIDNTVVSWTSYCGCAARHACPNPSEVSQCPAVEVPADHSAHYAIVSADRAAAYCAARGMRLPTAQELQAALRGPQGLGVPKCESVSGTSKHDCQFTSPSGVRAWTIRQEWTRSVECFPGDDSSHPELHHVALNSAFGSIGLPEGLPDDAWSYFRCVRDSLDVPK